MTTRMLFPRLLLGLVIAVAALWLALNRDQLDPALIESAVRTLGPWGPVAHIVLFAIGTVLFAPGALFGLLGGILFGPVLGTILNIAGATLGATAAFPVARYVAADWVREKAGTRLERLIKGVEAEGWRFVALTRLVPLVPFNLLNYALGLTRIPVVSYVLASLICMVPGTLAYTWLGHAGREAMAGNDAAIRYGLLGLGLLAAVAFAPRLLQRFNNERAVRWIEISELAPRLDGREDVAVIDVRGPDEFSGPLGHIANARNVPLPELPRRVAELASLTETPVVLVCKTDKRSASAAAVLDEAGFRDVSVLRGGMVRWNEAGLPVADRQASVGGKEG
jgi:uncharacterized membrane protein YdjX (TVP38/TMEM64 family)/rhodanese-related sulfurtransferase